MPSATIHSLTHPHKTGDQAALAACRRAQVNIKGGRYKDAASSLWPFWQGLGCEPDVTGLQLSSAAELYLSVARVVGLLDSSEESQRLSRQLATDAESLFRIGGDLDGCGRCLRQRARTFWVCGDTASAKQILDETSRSHDSYKLDTVCLLLIDGAIYERGLDNYEAALELHRRSAPLFELTNDFELRGAYHNGYALTYEGLAVSDVQVEYLQKSLIEYTAASIYFEDVGHGESVSAVQNNIAEVLSRLGEHTTAHNYLDRARDYALAADDKVRAAWFDDARARILKSEGRLIEARDVILDALATLHAHDAALYIPRAEKTLAEIESEINLAPPSPDNGTADVIPFVVPLSRLPKMFTLTASDDSMIGAGIAEGDNVYFVAESEPKDGDLVAVSTPDGIFMRIYQDEGGNILLLCAHPECPPQSYAREAVRFYGIVRPEQSR